jgi:2-oxoisovalerate dehydrogenase E1 component
VLLDEHRVSRGRSYAGLDGEAERLRQELSPDSGPAARLTPAALRQAYRAMLRIRRIEERIAERYGDQEMRCPVHLSIGQEAAAVGACLPLSREDLIVTSHRGHGHYLAKGGSLQAMLDELYGRASGCCGGRGGSMHLFDVGAGVLGSVPIVASSIPLAVGAGLHLGRAGQRRVSVAFLGDGAAEEGVFHESLNLAAVRRLPVVFFVENNLYSVYTPLAERQPERPLTLLAAAHAVPALAADGNDVQAVWRVMSQALARARSGAGPTLIVADTYRFLEHCGPSDDDALGYRPAGELAAWRERCPVARLRAALEAEGILESGAHARFEAEIAREIDGAFVSARAAAFPDPATRAEHVYPPTRPVSAAAHSGAGPARELTAAEAIGEATRQAMRADKRVIVLGEGVTDPKAIFGTTQGLLEEFGPERVLEMPLSENAFTGMAVGAALLGTRPIVIHQRVEFSLLAFEQIVNNAAKLCYVSGGQHRVPIVLRLIVGRGWGQGPAHSQSLEALFAHVPGLKVVMPSNAVDAKGLLLGAIADDAPVVFIEHRWMHAARGNVSITAEPLPLDGPRRLRAGRDATVVASSYATLEARQAADALSAVGCEVELFDLRVVRPLVHGPIVESVKRTGRLLVVDSGHMDFGVGAELCTRVTHACFEQLLGPPERLGLPDHPTPSAARLSEHYYPRAAQIAEAIGRGVGLPEAALTAVLHELSRQREGVPCDVPHPAFRGPF